MATVRGLVLALLGVSLIGVIDARSLLATTNELTYVLAIFGDSLTDTGNTFRLVGLPDPAIYWNGRAANGPNWVDYLNSTLSIKNKVQVFNYAYAGAPSCPSAYMDAYFPYVKDLGNQTAAFLADIKSGRIPLGKNVRIIPLQLIGANDILIALQGVLTTGVFPSEAEIAALMGSMVACRLRALQAAAEAPGVRDAVLLPMVPLHIAPVAPAVFRPVLKQLMDSIDAKSAAGVAQLQSLLSARPAGSLGAGVRVHAVGANAMLARGATAVNASIKAEPCLYNPGSVLRRSANLTVCTNPDDHLFYDDVHISTRFHEWVANRVLLPRLQQLRVLPTDV